MAPAHAKGLVSPQAVFAVPRRKRLAQTCVRMGGLLAGRGVTVIFAMRGLRQ